MDCYAWKIKFSLNKINKVIKLFMKEQRELQGEIELKKESQLKKEIEPEIDSDLQNVSLKERLS